MERKLLTKRGQRLYRMRGVLVEPVYGQVKEGQGFRRFMSGALSDLSDSVSESLPKGRGLEAAYGEASLVATSHNWRSGVLSNLSDSVSESLPKGGQAPWGWARAQWN